MRFTGFGPQGPDPRHTRKTAIAHPTFVTSVMALWDKRFDTDRIARVLFEHEHVIASCLHVGLERRRGQEDYEHKLAAVALAMEG